MTNIDLFVNDDFFSMLLAREGEPANARKLGEREVAPYRSKVPPALIQFWMDHGLGSYRQGRYWICDPKNFQPVIEQIFEGDPEFDPAEMTVVGYDAFAALTIWHRRRRSVFVDMISPRVFNPEKDSYVDKRSGELLSEDIAVGRSLTRFLVRDDLDDDDGFPLFPRAVEHLGSLESEEIYGFFPPLSYGGARMLGNLKRVNGPIHMSILAQMSLFTLTRLTPPNPPDEPFGRIVRIRPIGPQDKN